MGNRKYTLNETYFDAISSSDKAYWLGFITADGNTTIGHNYRLRVELANKDIEHLVLLQEYLGSNYPILGPRKGCMRIEIHSRHLVQSLFNIGIIPNKSGVVEPWVGASDLMPSYWRGLFDGDGSIGKKRKDQWWLNICGSYSCVSEFAYWAKSLCGSTAVPLCNGPEFWEWTVEGVGMARELAIALYEDADVSLKRKHDLANELMQLEGDHHRRKLSNVDVIQIRELYSAGGITQKQLAVRYGVIQQNISKIVRGMTHSSVKR